MKKTFIVIALLGSTLIGRAQNSKNLVPQIFQPGVISKGDYESHGTFTPTGDTLYFIKCSYDLKISAICVSNKRNSKWTDPHVASPPGPPPAAAPPAAPAGPALYFMSNRPLMEGDPVKDDTDIWKVIMTQNGWSAPIHLDAPINSGKDEYYPTLADNGDIYFGSTREGGKGGSDIWCCKYRDGKYQPAENLGDAVNTEYHDYEAFIAPDESYLIYNSSRPNGLKNLNFYISFNHNGVWTKAQKLPAPISSDTIDWSPKVTHDGKWFYFGSTRSTAPVIPAKAAYIQQLDKTLQSANNG